ncbi:MAG: hypothetical protein IJS45_03825 [Clostridia bacterium]|nr:hypothetical protein [Clostridia bacterium]
MEYLLYGHVEVEKNGRTAKIKLPFYFPMSEGGFEFVATEKKSSVILSDCGAAYRELSQKTDDPYILGEVFDYLARVFLNIEPSEDRALTWLISESDMRRFFTFIQCVSICANADLYPFVNEELQGECEKYITRRDFPSDGEYPAQFVEDLNRSISLEDGIVRSNFAFKDETDPMSIQVESGNGIFTLTDRGGFDGGDIIERIKWNNKDDIRQFGAVIKETCARFGAEYNGKFSCSFKDGDSLPTAVFTFMQFASILGELGAAVTVG